MNRFGFFERRLARGLLELSLLISPLLGRLSRSSRNVFPKDAEAQRTIATSSVRAPRQVVTALPLRLLLNHQGHRYVRLPDR